MTNKHILIVEDEVFVTLQLQGILKDLGYGNVSVANSYEQAVSFLSKGDVDAVLSDINLEQNKSGIDVAKFIDRNVTKQIPYLFISAYSDTETLNQISELKAKHFIRKPFHPEDVRIALELHLFPNLNKQKQTLSFQVGRIEIQTDIDDILFLESNDNFVVIHTINGHHRVYQTLKSFLDRLPSKFIQVHRSFIINLKFVQNAGAEFVEIGGTEIPISRKYKAVFRKCYFRE